jgi:hypothetical protein
MKLASVEKILNIVDVENTDFLQVATVKGWQCIINKKDNLKVGDKVCYIEIDTICPETEQFEFLRKYQFRVKTQKMKGQISQGLVIPLKQNWSNKIGDNLTDIIGIKKYEKPQPIEEEKEKIPVKYWKKQWYYFRFNYLYKWFPSLKKKQRHKFPSDLVQKTDETRIQNLYSYVSSNYTGKKFDVKFKLDGSSITLILQKKWGKYSTRICSRNFELFNKVNEWTQVFEKTNFQKHLEKLSIYYKTSNIIVQGEYIGKPQGNPYKLDNQIRLFNIFVNGVQLLPKEFNEMTTLLQIPICPIYKEIVFNHSLEELLKISETPCPLNEKAVNEGMVWRCLEDGYSFKVVSNKYLLQEK